MYILCAHVINYVQIIKQFNKQSDQSLILSIFTSITCPYDLDLIDANSWALLELYGLEKRTQ